MYNILNAHVLSLCYSGSVLCGPSMCDCEKTTGAQVLCGSVIWRKQSEGRGHLPSSNMNGVWGQSLDMQPLLCVLKLCLESEGQEAWLCTYPGFALQSVSAASATVLPQALPFLKFVVWSLVPCLDFCQCSVAEGVRVLSTYIVLC